MEWSTIMEWSTMVCCIALLERASTLATPHAWLRSSLPSSAGPLPTLTRRGNPGMPTPAEPTHHGARGPLTARWGQPPW